MRQYKDGLSIVTVERSQYKHTIKMLGAADGCGYIIISESVTDCEYLTTCYLIDEYSEALAIQSKLINGTPF